MERIARIWTSTLVAALLAFTFGSQAAYALTKSELKCLDTVGKAGTNFVKKRMKAIQKCNDKNLKETGNCPAEDLAAAIDKIEVKLDDKIQSKCGELAAHHFTDIGYPGKCLQAVPGGDFTVEDLKNCIHDSHEAIVDQLIAIEYGATTGPIEDNALLKCQREIAKNGGKFAHLKLKTVQKCRTNLIKGKIFGFAAKNCATADPKTKEKIEKAEGKAREKILGKCTDPQIEALDVNAAGVAGCDPKATTVQEAADCIIKTHGDAVDNPDATAPADLIDYQYATPLSCGDHVLNSSVNPTDLNEECDGPADAACPGQCGAPTGPFACLCLDQKRQRISERAAPSDSDSGWTGLTHDQRVVPGAGYLLDLYECDGVTDFDCIVGPNCTGTKCLGGSNAGALCSVDSQCPGGTCSHAQCSKDSDCTGGTGPCRKKRTATGKHCNLDVKAACTTNAQCPGTGNYCVLTPHGPPLPLSAGGVSVCASTFFIEDITGTTNLQTGATVIHVHQETPTRLGPNLFQPCPVCGGFCAAPRGSSDRRNCTSDADCAALPGSPPCVTDLICSAGPNIDKECRPEPPFGGNNGIFGTTSSDCPVDPLLTLAGNIDNDFNPLTTGTSTLTPQYQCDAPGFENKVCLGGANDGRACVTDSECPGATCGHQCYCPTKGAGVGILQKPNDCDAACLGGANDAAPCAADSACPGGFCHQADCRLNPADPEGADEGICTVGPLYNLCSITTFKECSSDNDCRPPACPLCRPDETCGAGLRQCFPNAGFSRTGVASPDDLTLVVAYCIAGVPSASVNAVSGFPGPAGQRYAADRYTTGF